MEGASHAACLVVDMDFSNIETQAQLRTIISLIQKMLPPNTPQRVIISNGWLILCTLMVCIKENTLLVYVHVVDMI